MNALIKYWNTTFSVIYHFFDHRWWNFVFFERLIGRGAECGLLSLIKWTWQYTSGTIIMYANSVLNISDESSFHELYMKSIVFVWNISCTIVRYKEINWFVLYMIIRDMRYIYHFLLINYFFQENHLTKQ